MQIIVLKSPRFLRGILKAVFKISKKEKES